MVFIMSILSLILLTSLSAYGINNMFLGSFYTFIVYFIIMLVGIVVSTIIKKYVYDKLQNVYKLTLSVLYSTIIVIIYIGFYNLLYRFMITYNSVEICIYSTTAIVMTVLTLYCGECVVGDR